MGDDIPPGEINRQTAMGQHFGHPWYGGGDVRTNEYKGEDVPVDVVFPVAETVAHAADLEMVFYTGSMFPKKYQGGIFSAQHGSWNRTTPIGARVMFTPVDAAQLKDGSLLVSDDLAGAVYRIAYTGSGS